MRARLAPRSPGGGAQRGWGNDTPAAHRFAALCIAAVLGKSAALKPLFSPNSLSCSLRESEGPGALCTTVQLLNADTEGGLPKFGSIGPSPLVVDPQTGSVRVGVGGLPSAEAANSTSLRVYAYFGNDDVESARTYATIVATLVDV